MPEPSPADLRILAAWINADRSAKVAAGYLGIRPDTFSKRLARVCRRHGVNGPARLAVELAESVRPLLHEVA